MTPNVAYMQVPLGVPTSVIQNQTFALPNVACVILSTVALEVGFAQAGPYVAAPTSATTGLNTGATWARCTTAAAVVSAKQLV